MTEKKIIEQTLSELKTNFNLGISKPLEFRKQ